MKIISNLFRAVLLIGLLASLGVSFFLYTQINSIKNQISQSSQDQPGTYMIPEDAAESVQTDLSEYATKKYVDDKVAGINTSSGTTTTVTKTVVAPKEPQTTYIPITGGFSTKSLDWVDVPGTEFYLDLATDYDANAIVTWEAFIREEHGNGYAEARLYDATNNIVVDNSEISSNDQASTLVSSSNLAIWRGKNLYKVQMRSQKGFYVYFDSGKLKISY